MMYQRNTSVGALGLLVALALPVQLYGSGVLGVANDYNVFVLNNLTVTGSDTGGRMAVGGKASFVQTWYSVGDAILDGFTAPNDDTLDVDGTISNGPAQVYAGNSNGAGDAYLASGSPSDVSLAGGGTLTQGGSSPVNVAGQYYFLNSYATQLSQLTANSTIANNGYGSITLTGTSSTLDIFDLPIADLGGNNAIYFDVSSTATVLINVIGTSVTTLAAGFFWNGTQINGNAATEYEKVLFNFDQATSIDLAGTFEGTILAPNAAVTGSNGQLDGGLIAQSYYGSNEFHDILFTGTLPAYTSAAPEPTPFVLCGGVLLMLGMAGRRRSK